MLLFLFSIVVCPAQTTTEKEQSPAPSFISSKKSPLKIIFDDSQSQLISIDTSGRIVENAIVAFQLYVTIKGVNYSEQALGSSLSNAMLLLLGKAEQNTVIYFEHIQIKNTAGKLLEADDFQYTLGYVNKKKEQ